MTFIIITRDSILIIHVIRYNTSSQASSIEIFGVKMWNCWTLYLTYQEVNLNPLSLHIQIFHIIFFINCLKGYHLLYALYCMFVPSSIQYYFVMFGPTKKQLAYWGLELYISSDGQPLLQFNSIFFCLVFTVSNRLHNRFYS